MPRRGTRSLVLVVCAALVLPASASAADPGAATIVVCRGDTITVAGKVSVNGSAARKVRGASLQMRFQAMALFGFPHVGKWNDEGKKRKVSGQETFAGLPADDWLGVLDWRFKKGSRTVLAGIARSEPLRIGRKGRANCTLPEGAKVPDAAPPTLSINPDDAAWHHAPAGVQLLAQDAYTGVKSMRYALDGGPLTPITNGSGFTITTEGAHTVGWQATDVAGNTGARSAVVRVDAAPPTKPALSRPAAVTASETPTFTWSASADSGSGLRGYQVTIRRTDGVAVAVQFADAATTQLTSSTVLNDGQTYTATVTAVDNAVPAWTTDSDPLTFRVDRTPDVSSASPASGTVLSGGLNGGNFTLNLDRAADPATVSSSTVVLRNVDSGTNVTPNSVGCAAMPCTAVVFDPQPGSLPEGRYTLTLSGVRSSEEGLTFQPYAAAYAAPFVDDPAGLDATGGSCAAPNASRVVTVTSSSAAEAATLSFDWSFSGGTGWSIEVAPSTNTGNVLGSTVGTTGSGHVSIPFQIPAGTSSLTITVKRNCPTIASSPGSFDSSSMIGSRNP